MMSTSLHTYHPIVAFDSQHDRLMQLDLTDNNKELSDELLANNDLFTHWVNEQLQQANARYAIGGYNELRTIYRVSKVFNGDAPGEEPRRLHLGTDIWGKPGTPVMAPLDGLVHSFAFNDQHRDYGATIILSHAFNGTCFYTLYGHLSLASIKNLREGDRVNKGDTIAAFGIPLENGHWPPHLHFQLINDIGNWSGDYPGVCKFSEKERWLSNSPDPDTILQLNQYIDRSFVN
jgi:murein DD-endopeptidase MepM/ murein hydrolase activator NlpD